MESAVRVPVSRVLAKALQAEGVRGLYRGFLPNALKNLPNKGAGLCTPGWLVCAWSYLLPAVRSPYCCIFQAVTDPDKRDAARMQTCLRPYADHGPRLSLLRPCRHPTVDL
jgi:hypothetical protein